MDDKDSKPTLSLPRAEVDADDVAGDGGSGETKTKHCDGSGGEDYASAAEDHDKAGKDDRFADANEDDDADDNDDNGDATDADGRSNPPSKRPRDETTTDNDESVAPATKKRPPSKEIQMTIAKYKAKKGSTYDVIYENEVDPDATNTGDAPLGINFASVRVRNAHTYLTTYFVGPTGEGYRGRPPSPSDSAIIVESLLANAPEETQSQVRPNDILLFIDDRLVNLTDKKRLKYYMARLNKDTRPMKLTFFRPSEEEVEVNEDEDIKLDRSDHAGFTSKDEEGEGKETKSKPKTKEEKAKFEREKRRKLLEARLEQLETLIVETSSELHELRRKDGFVTVTPVDEGQKEGSIVNSENNRDEGDDIVIPPHIMYYPPTKIRRKKIKALNDACKNIESILRQRHGIDKEADKIRVVVDEAQSRLDIKEKELAALDEKLAPVLEQVKFIEMEVKDNWKNMYLKLKEYYEKFGHSNVMEKEDSKLSKWITRQRTCYANAQLEDPNPAMGIIKPYQYELLNKLEFCWNPREQQFHQNISMLKQFKAEFGHTNVPMKYENIHLANFVQKWRREYRLFQEGKPSNMSQDRLQILEEVGFSWRDPSRQRKRSDTRQETWDGFVSQLKAFHDQHGHFMVNKINKTKGKGNKLGRLDEFCSWVRKQYILFKEGSPCQLTQAKVKELKEIGFWLERGEANKYVTQKKIKKAEERGRAKEPGFPKVEDVPEAKKDEGKTELDENEEGAKEEEEKPDEDMAGAAADLPEAAIV